MKLSPRERLLAVYCGRETDAVPAIADLSYWHAGNGGGKFIPGKTDGANRDKVDDLLRLHRRTGAAIHLNLGTFYREVHGEGVRSISGIEGEYYIHRYETPVGTVEERRMWSDTSYSWPIVHHMIQKVEDLQVMRYVFERIHYEADWEQFRAVDTRVGDLGLPIVQVPYTGMGFLMSRYAGVEQTVMFADDAPDEIQATLDTINAAQLKVCRLMAEGPSQVIFHSDNLTADVQSPPWFAKYSAAHFRRMADIAHEYGKPIITHIDGRLRGLLRATGECGIDGADAVTPAPWGDLSPAACRAEAGPRYVLSGGVPPDSFNPTVPLRTFDEHVEAWLSLRHASPALIIAPGDQLPPGGDMERVTRMVAAADAATYR